MIKVHEVYHLKLKKFQALCIHESDSSVMLPETLQGFCDLESA